MAELRSSPKKIEKEVELEDLYDSGILVFKCDLAWLSGANGHDS